jgi:hypothetical protein
MGEDPLAKSVTLFWRLSKYSLCAGLEAQVSGVRVVQEQ